MARPGKKPSARPAAERRVAAPPGDRALTWIVAGGLALATAIVYAQVRGFPFIDNYDDSLYVTANPHVTGGLSPANIAWAITGVCAGNWHPLTMLSHMLDCQLFGVVPGPAHVVNLLLHVANVVLLFLMLAAVTRAPWPSALVAGLFALHPVHVESVAWIAERKDVLSTLFLLLTLWAYARYVRDRRRRTYVLMLVLFALGLMAKPMLVTLPFALVLVDWWPLGRLAGSTATKRGGQISIVQSLREKLPLFLLTLGSVGTTLYAQAAAGAAAGTFQLPLGLRLGNAALAYAAYVGKLLVPVHLAFLYPYPVTIPATEAAGAVLLLAAITVAVIVLRRRMPYAAAGWLWYVGTLVPVIGIVQVGSQAMADRYTYIPFIGLTVAIVWSLRDAAARLRLPRPVLVAAGGAILLASAYGTWRQLGYWKDAPSLFRHGIEVTNGNFLAHNNYGVELLRLGKTEESRAEFARAVEINPAHVDSWSNYGIVLRMLGRYDEAERALERGLALAPRDAKMHYNLAVALALQKRYPEAFEHFESALREAPANPETHLSYSNALSNYGVTLSESGRHAEAIRCYERALSVNPQNDAARKNLELDRGMTPPAGGAAR